MRKIEEIMKDAQKLAVEIAEATITILDDKEKEPHVEDNNVPCQLFQLMWVAQVAMDAHVGAMTEGVDWAERLEMMCENFPLAPLDGSTDEVLQAIIRLAIRCGYTVADMTDAGWSEETINSIIRAATELH